MNDINNNNNTVIKCFECNSTNNMVYHHVVPQSLGGKNTLPLCQLCHDKVHHLLNPRNISISELTKHGLQHAKQRGVKLGNPNILTISKQGLKARQTKSKLFTQQLRPIALQLLSKGLTITQVAHHFNNHLNLKTIHNKPWSRTTISYLINNTPPQ